MIRVTPVIIALAVMVGGCASTDSDDGTAYSKALSLYDEGSYSKAVTECDKAIAAEERPAMAHLLRGKCREKMGSTQPAVSDYKRSRSLDPNLVEAYVREARLYYLSGNPSAAIDTLNDSEEFVSGMNAKERFYLWAVRGEALVEANRPADAIKALTEAIQTAGTASFRGNMPLALAYYTLSRAYFQTGSFRASKEAYNRYLDGKKRSGSTVSGEDIFTECVLLYLTGNVRTAKKKASALPGSLRQEAESIISGNSLSVQGVFEDPEDGSKERR